MTLSVPTFPEISKARMAKKRRKMSLGTQPLLNGCKSPPVNRSSSIAGSKLKI